MPAAFYRAKMNRCQKVRIDTPRHGFPLKFPQHQTKEVWLRNESHNYEVKLPESSDPNPHQSHVPPRLSRGSEDDRAAAKERMDRFPEE